MSVAAFLTYNSVGSAGSFPNGLVELNGHKAVIIQHPKGKQWGIDRKRDDIRPEANGPKCKEDCTNDEQRAELERLNQSRQGAIHTLYQQVFGLEEELDQIVVYVGAGGSEGAIRLAAQFPAEKVCFVLCDCNLSYKRRIIAERGMQASRVILCECGGQGTMGRLATGFLQTGKL